MQSDYIDVVVNGERKSLPSGLTVTALLQVLEMPLDRIAVELNKSIVRKRSWAETPVPEGSQIEIVQFVGGG
jgi:thiamine biosynthesis protein ThiS